MFLFSFSGLRSQHTPYGEQSKTQHLIARKHPLSETDMGQPGSRQQF